MSKFQRLSPARPELMKDTDFRSGDFAQSRLGVELQGAVQSIALVEETHHPQLVNVPDVLEEDLSSRGPSDNPFCRTAVFPALVHGPICQERLQPDFSGEVVAGLKA